MMIIRDWMRGRNIPVTFYDGNGDTLLLFSHGGGEDGDAYGYLGEALRVAGISFACMTHDDTSRGEEALNSAQERLADFDRCLRYFRKRFSSIVVGGQCAGSSTGAYFGGATVYIDNVPTAGASPFVDGCVMLGPQIPGGPEMRVDSWSTIEVPTLFVTAENDWDWLDREDDRLYAFETCPGEKYLLDLPGAHHSAFTDSDPWYPSPPRNPEDHAQIAARVVQFFCDVIL
jgi:dienelactone hydrolase